MVGDRLRVRAINVVAAKIAAASGAFDGRRNAYGRLYLDRCTWVCPPLVVIFTRDFGHHTSGWFKNPDFERCLHLSLSKRDIATWQPDTLSVREAWPLVREFFGDDARRCWTEGPATPTGRKFGVLHFRVFCDAAWVPISPRGEVYSRELTEAGWKSCSDLGVEIESPLSPG